MKKLLKNMLVIAILLSLPIQPVRACASCSGGGPQYKGHSLAEASGYFAKEFDKVASQPGMDWDGEPNTWIASAYSNGWVVKTSPQDAEPGALILGFDQDHNVWVGIVRTVTSGTIQFDTFDSRGKLIHNTTNAAIIKSDFHLLGYIWPVRQKSWKGH